MSKCAKKLVAILFATALASIIGCASAPKPTIAQISLEAMANVNPDARGRASPVVVRLYELKTSTVFDNADFFSLYERDQETLGAELVAKEEIQLSPGEKREFQRMPQAATHVIGVIAAFRDLDHAQWRATAKIVPAQTTTIAIKLDGSKIVVESH